MAVDLVSAIIAPAMFSARPSVVPGLQTKLIGRRYSPKLTLRKIWVRGNGCKSNATFALRRFLVEKRALPQPDQVV